jgi:hypothetical protein
MNYLIQQHNIFLNTTKHRIANNLNDIDEIMEVELKHSKNDGMDDTEMTLHEQFMAQLDAKGNSLFAGMETTKVPGSFRILFHEQKADVVDTFLLDIDTKLEDLGQWSDITAHYWYSMLEVVTIIGSQIAPQQTASFWNNHFAQIGWAAIPSKLETETMIAPPRVKCQTGVRMSHSQATASRPEPHHASVTHDVTTPTSTGVQNSPMSEPPSLPHEGAASGLSNVKKRLAEIENERLAFKAEKIALDDEVSTLTKYVSKMSEEMLEIRRDLTELGSSLKKQRSHLKELIFADVE